MKVIDLRCRPAFLHPFFGGVPGSPEHATARWLNRRVGTRGADDHFERSLTQEGFLAEVREAGLHKVVVVGRHTPGQHLSNDRIHGIVHGHTELLGVGSVEPALQGVEGALAEIDRAIDVLGLAGIDLEPGFAEPARHPDDPLYWPIYEHLQQRGIPLFLMSGPTTPDPAYNDPGRLAAVARAFPELRIVAYHGYWPNVQQAIGVAFRYENISLVPDMYLFLPGSEGYVQAANGFLADQLLFGSSYTFRPIRQSIEDAQRLGLKDEVLEKFFHGNAERLFGL
ncbi:MULTISPECIES: amidohydrolase family protein [unclassified Pseudomonas]|uniref:amidohydrolase family protein n=1 Tax=unclassified Pseudomonas TaxID=196821 RepID=UPI002449CFA1|nr:MULTISPECIES: amidohydrolase family protein [unclassified Pseudomonas]MDG9928329.1 amidohydrolase family protein [Pseudomonas sp. GD04042]MDH0481107.1 amidohydrolase family protein [Pseudomonas sp. GD04015]MDH0604443.1 amidohydrolase family protein [Pseudomonas sp. GD03869]